MVPSPCAKTVSKKFFSAAISKSFESANLKFLNSFVIRGLDLDLFQCFQIVRRNYTVLLQNKLILKCVRFVRSKSVHIIYRSSVIFFSLTKFSISSEFKGETIFFEIADNFIGWYLQIVKFKWSQWFWASAKVVFNSNNSKWELRFWHITKPVGQSNFALWVADITDKTDITESKNRYVTLISSGILGVKRIFIRSCDEIAWVWRKKV